LERFTQQFLLLEASHFSAPLAHSQESTCLQTGRNSPSWVTCRTVTVDDNFYADHIRMCQPDLDIMLMDGQEEYMVEEVRFKEYLSVAKEMHGANLD
jgi:hypothetical protein